MSEFKLSSGGRPLRSMLAPIEDLVANVNFECSETGLSLQAMDSNHVAKVSLLLRSGYFDFYRFDRNVSMGMNVTNMLRMLKCAGDNDIISFIADIESDTVSFIFESYTKYKFFEMKLMDIDNEHDLGITEVEEYHATIRMPSAEFAEICKDISSFGDSVVISVTKKGVEFSTKGDTGNVKVVYKQDESTIVEMMNEPVSLTLAIKYMNSFAKAALISDTVTISLSPALPVMFNYEIIETASYIRFYLASN